MNQDYSFTFTRPDGSTHRVVVDPDDPVSIVEGHTEGLEWQQERRVTLEELRALADVADASARAYRRIVERMELTGSWRLG